METIVLKIGGAFLEKIENSSLFSDIQELVKQGKKFIIIHGGGPFITKALENVGKGTEFIDGQRVTQESDMEIIESVLSGQINKTLVRKFNKLNISCMGLSGIDQKTLKANQTNPELGRVGVVSQVNTKFLAELMKITDVLVLSPVALAEDGEAVNVNADVSAMAVAKALRVSRMFYISEGAGLLDEKGVTIPQLSLKQVEELISKGIIYGGMIIKTQMVVEGLKAGIKEVALLDASQANALSSWFQGEKHGTLFS